MKALSRHEQVSRDYVSRDTSPIINTCSLRDKLIILWIIFVSPFSQISQAAILPCCWGNIYLYKVSNRNSKEGVKFVET